MYVVRITTDNNTAIVETQSITGIKSVRVVSSVFSYVLTNVADMHSV
jgi:hypothetical protein